MKKIVVIGDFAVDRSIHVQATRLCPEAPVPVVIPQRETSTAGMAGNVLANLESISGYPAENFVAFGPDCDNEKLRYIDASTGYIMLRVDRDCLKEVEPPFNPAHLWSEVDSANIGAIVISDYAKGFLNQKNIAELASRARSLKIPTFLDTKMVLGEWSKDIFCVKINQKEYEYNLKAGVQYPADYCQHFVVTQGGAGTRYICGRTETLIPVANVNVADVCGAGDTMLAALVLKYVSYPDLEGAIYFANAVASFAVTKHGVYCATRQDITDLGLLL